MLLFQFHYDESIQRLKIEQVSKQILRLDFEKLRRIQIQIKTI